VIGQNKLSVIGQNKLSRDWSDWLWLGVEQGLKKGRKLDLRGFPPGP